jgi:hypothetical protein
VVSLLRGCRVRSCGALLDGERAMDGFRRLRPQYHLFGDFDFVAVVSCVRAPPSLLLRVSAAAFVLDLFSAVHVLVVLTYSLPDGQGLVTHPNVFVHSLNLPAVDAACWHFSLYGLCSSPQEL